MWNYSLAKGTFIGRLKWSPVNTREKSNIPNYTRWRRETGKFEIIRKNEGNLQNFI
jgi:hypothetical protein